MSQKVAFIFVAKITVMKNIFSCAILLLSIGLYAQNAEDAPLPDIFMGIEEAIVVDHFPSPVYASIDPDNKGKYFWKHNSTVFSPSEDIEILEGGAFIFYNNQWNLRVTYDAKKFSKLFDIPKAKMKAGEPYTFVENWRGDTRLLGGWAMWYIIGTTASGQKVYGIGKLNTVGELYPQTSKN